MKSVLLFLLMVMWASEFYAHDDSVDYEPLSQVSGKGNRNQHPHVKNLFARYNAEKQLHQRPRIPKPRPVRNSTRITGQARSWRKTSIGQKRGCQLTQASDEPVSVPAVQKKHRPCLCGERPYNLRQPTGRIVGGLKTKKYEIPWRCSLNDPGTGHFCGATIISHEWLITAAHCFDEVWDKPIVICRFYDYNDEQELETRIERDVEDPILHEGYNKVSRENDIALIKVFPALSFGVDIQPACLPFKMTESNHKGLTVTASGWGKEHWEDQQTSHLLKKVTQETISSDDCQEYWEPYNPIDDRHVCTAASDVGSCTADSGGSIDLKDKVTGQYMILGVTSFGHNCTLPGYPSVYTRVATYLDWILENTAGDSFCRI